MKQLLKTLCETANIGSVTQTADLAAEQLRKLGTVTRDAMGNVQCIFGEGTRVMLDAHIDEIGFVVTGVQDGFVRVAKVGGIDPRTVVGKEVTVHGTKDLFGVFTSVPPHLKKEDKTAPELDQLAIDCGRLDLTDLVRPGDMVTFRRSFCMLQNGRCTAKSLDDRAGVAAVLLAARQLTNCGKQICVNLSTQEELGGRGATVSAFAFEPEYAIAVDVSFGDGRDIPETQSGKISGGVMIGVSPVLDKGMSDALMQTAGEHNIPYQIEAMGGKTGTNADWISVSKSGVKTAVLSIPLRNMHTGVELVDMADIQAVADLIVAYVGGVL